MSEQERRDVDLATAAEQSSEEDEAQEGNVLEQEVSSADSAEHSAIHVVDDEGQDVEAGLTELLDALASRFMQDGWSIKKMHKLIMLSQAYQRSSRVNETNAAIDPDNHFLWRQSLHRLDAESIRDSILLVSGANLWRKHDQ